MAKSFWDIEVVVCEVPINDRRKIVVKNTSKNGNDYVDVRQQYLDNKDGEWKHGKGISIPKEHAQDVAKIIEGAVQEGLPF